MSAVLFAGPSLGRRWLPDGPGIVVRPPAARGDIYRVACDRPLAIGLVDGYFDGVPAVAHKEILYALSCRIHVLGAASMGALRAAELAPFGMVPVGSIARAYATGALEADDEVAVLHGPAEAGWVALSEPLVNMRATLEAAQRAGVVDRDEAVALLEAAQSLHYRDRTWERLLGDGGWTSLRHWLPEGRVDRKRQDALALVAELRRLLDAGEPAPASTFALPPTQAWHELMAEAPADDIDPIDRIMLGELRLDPERYRRHRAAALAQLLAPGVAARDDARAWRERFRIEHGLMHGAELAAWLAARRRDRPWLDRQAAVAAALESVAEERREALMRAILDGLALEPDHPDRLARAHRKETLMRQAEEVRPPTFPDLSLERARSLDFADADELYQALLAQYLHDQQRD